MFTTLPLVTPSLISGHDRSKWQIWTKDGTLYEFAEDLWWGWDKCGVDIAGNCNGQGDDAYVETYKWLLTKVQDTHGNIVTYNYTNQRISHSESLRGFVSGVVDEDVWPTSITWGGDLTTGANPRYTVEFTSSARSNDMQFDLVSNANGQYNQHGVPHQTRRLDAVKIWSNSSSPYNSASLQLVRQYNLGYDSAVMR